MDRVKKKILVVGDVMVDRYYEGTTARLSPEAPVPVVRCPDGPKDYPGGAAHVAAAIAALGAPVGLIGQVGQDADAVELENAMAAAGIWYQPEVVRNWRTVVKTRITCEGRHLCRVDTELPMPDDRTLIGPESAQRIVALVGRLIDSGEVGLLVLSDYGKGVFTTGVAQAVISGASSRKIPIVVDPKNRDARTYNGATVVTPNFDEAVAAITYRDPEAGRDEFSITDDRIAEGLAMEYASFMPGTANVVVTRGASGCTLCSVAEQEFVNFPAFARCAYDPTGAGDVFVAALAVGMFEGRTVREALKMATVAAGVAVGVVGTSVVFREDLDAIIDASAEPTDKIMTAEQAVEWVGRRKRSGERVVFTNGCFDLLHSGHIHLLRQAKAYGHRLVVGINTDETVRALKGEGRPRNDLAERLAAVAEVPEVDAVVVFEEGTPEKLVHQLHPDVLVKGAEYAGRSVAGADFVAARGGRVAFVPMLAGYSTTEQLAKLLQTVRT